VDAITQQRAIEAPQTGTNNLAPALVDRLTALTGPWPVLLSLVNIAIGDRINDEATPDQATR
jgi:hypothetical protein